MGPVLSAWNWSSTFSFSSPLLLIQLAELPAPTRPGKGSTTAVGLTIGNGISYCSKAPGTLISCHWRCWHLVPLARRMLGDVPGLQALLLCKEFWMCQSGDTFSVSSKARCHTPMQRRRKPYLVFSLLITIISSLAPKYQIAITCHPWDNGSWAEKKKSEKHRILL